MSSHGRKQGGFTLIELLVVVCILGILMAIMIPAFDHSGGPSKAACSKVHDGKVRTPSQLSFPAKTWIYRTAPGTKGRTFAVVEPGRYMAIKAYLLNGPEYGGVYRVYEIGQKGCKFPDYGVKPNLPEQFIIFLPGTRSSFPINWGDLKVVKLAPPVKKSK